LSINECKTKIMKYFIVIFVIFIFLFVGMLFYKLSNVSWYYQFFTQNFKDKDYFTRFVKWLMS
jgi:ABC-type uncharacterized transport system permease subunit